MIYYFCKHFKREEIFLSKFKELKKLSKDVSLVKRVETGKLYVLKYAPIKQLELYRTLSILDSPHFPKVCYLKDLGTKIQILEEYIQGKNLEKELEEHIILPPSKVKHYMLELCKAVGELHSVGIVHKDISANNIVITKDNQPILIDFGISKYCDVNSKDTSHMGTVGYASPEHFGFSNTDERSDIYSLGVLMNVMLIGSYPEDEVFTDYGFGKIIRKCVQLSSDKRYKDVSALYKDLDKIKLKVKSAEVYYNSEELSEQTLLNVDTMLLHKQYYQAIEVLQEAMSSERNCLMRELYLYKLSIAYEQLGDVDTSAKIIIDKIYNDRMILSSSDLYHRLISLSSRVSKSLRKDIYNIRKNYVVGDSTPMHIPIIDKYIF